MSTGGGQSGQRALAHHRQIAQDVGIANDEGMRFTRLAIRERGQLIGRAILVRMIGDLDVGAALGHGLAEASRRSSVGVEPVSLRAVRGDGEVESRSAPLGCQVRSALILDRDQRRMVPGV